MRGANRAIAVLFALSALASLTLAAVYVAGGEPQAEGPLLAVALGGIGTGLIVWARRLMPHRDATEPRAPASDPRELDRAQEALEEGEHEIARRGFLVTLLAAAGGALGLALAFPVRSLGPSPGRTLVETPWRAGLRLITDDGQPVTPDAVEYGSVVTVFPEHAAGSADGQAVLIRVDPERLQPLEGRGAWTPQGNVCYSKVCTHAGCPVGLYIETEHALRCPCHQSMFDVLRGAAAIGGPAVRALPQLPLEVDAEGYLIAGGGFSAPVGPSFWNMP